MENTVIKEGFSATPSPEAVSGDKPRYTFPKKEKICGKNDISRLLSSGKYITTPVLRCCCLPDNGLPHSRIMISVPKKSFKRAVKRNLLKRRIREAYRLNKNILPQGKGADLLLIYCPKEVLPSEDIHSSMVDILKEVSKRISSSDRNAGTKTPGGE
ncbi:MAG: ribonuclease P protein component [Bacteroidales bacterium]|nr:ribonuclease P protein component [Bacteroidales bacterium]MBQ9712898.1 ribonuclease P protein component [Bacteroidales bacterium]MBR1435516.1 ribonuclease P protein component [Bacteroidales bacterium]